MSIIVWILPGLGLIAGKVVSTTGEGTVVDFPTYAGGFLRRAIPHIANRKLAARRRFR